MGQRPEALFITCLDSRIDPSLLTQTKPGELFICRVIGNVVPPYPDAIGGVSATIEYAVGVLRVPEVIVCGHTDCGVMRGALNPDALEAFPNVTAWLRYANVEHREADRVRNFSRAHGKRCGGAIEKPEHTSDGCRSVETRRSGAAWWVYHIGPGTVTVFDESTGRFERVLRIRRMLSKFSSVVYSKIMRTRAKRAMSGVKKTSRKQPRAGVVSC